MSKDIAKTLLKQATKLFLEKDFHSVSIREIAKRAGTSSGMINYYFGSKHGLFEEMIKLEHSKVLVILDDIIEQQEILDFSDIVTNVMQVYEANPSMPKFIIKTLLLRQGPGSQFLKDSFEAEKNLVYKWVKRVIIEGKVDQDLNSEVARISFMCLTLLPSMMRDSLISSYGESGHKDFLQEFSEFAGGMLMYGFKPKSKSKDT